MARKLIGQQTARHVNIFDEDWEFLSELFGRGSLRPIGVSQAIRAIVHARVAQLRATYNMVLDSAPGPSALPVPPEETATSPSPEELGL